MYVGVKDLLERAFVEVDDQIFFLFLMERIVMEMEMRLKI